MMQSPEFSGSLQLQCLQPTSHRDISQTTFLHLFGILRIGGGQRSTPRDLRGGKEGEIQRGQKDVFCRGPEKGDLVAMTTNSSGSPGEGGQERDLRN